MEMANGFEGFKVTNLAPSISCVFVDDSMFFLKANSAGARGFVRTLNEFCKQSG